MNTNRIKIAFVTSAAAMLLLAGCAVHGTTAAPNVTPVKGSSVDTSAPATNDLQKGFGEVITYKTGVSISVSAPAPYQASEYAAGVQPGQTQLVFTVQITNNGKANVEIGGFPTLNSGGAAANSITDLQNNIGVPPVTTLLPTQSITFQDAYSVADQNDLTYLITPVVGYQQAIFTTKK